MHEVPAPPADATPPAGTPDGPPGPAPRRREGWVARLTRGVLGLCMGLVVIVVVLPAVAVPEGPEPWNAPHEPAPNVPAMPLATICCHASYSWS